MRRVTPAYLEKVFACIERSIAETSHSDEEKAGHLFDFRRDAREQLGASIVLEFEVIADAEQAHVVFEEKAAKLMDLFQMSTAIAEFCASARIGLRGKTHSGLYSGWVLSIDGSGFYQPSRRVGALGNLCLSDGNLFLMRRAGIMQLADALRRMATPLENALFRGAHWFAEGLRQEHKGHATLCFVICLESVLPSSSGRTMAEAVALLAEIPAMHRRRRYSLILEAYHVRNTVVHEGESGYDFPAEPQFRAAVLEFFRIVIGLSDRLTTPQSLAKYIESLRFG